jgi:hypothetical protein
MPHKVRKRILERCQKGEICVVIPDKQGKPARVHGIRGYEEARARAKRNKPWTHKKVQPKNGSDSQVETSQEQE